MKENEPARYATVEYAPPTLLFDERLTIDGGDLTVDLIATHGHAPGHISVWIPEIATLLTGDAAEAPFPFARTVAALPALRQSLAHMAALNPEVVFYSHAAETLGPSLLHDDITYFDMLEQRCREAMARGVSAQSEGDLAALIDFPFDAAVPRGIDSARLHAFYREEGHPMQIRMMLEHLAAGSARGRQRRSSSGTV